MTKISIKVKIEEVGKFSSDNIYAIIPTEPINLEAERMGIIDAITISYSGELCVGDTITIQDIDLNNLANTSRRITENNGIRSWDIRGSFGGIVINERVLGIENLDQAIRQNNENPSSHFFIFKGADLQDEVSWEWDFPNIERTQPGEQISGMTVKRIEVNKNGHPSEHYVAFWTVDGYYGCVGKVPINIWHKTATYRLNGNLKINGEDLEAIVFLGRQNFCSGTELPFAPNDKGLNSLIGRWTYLNKENLYIIANKEDFDGSFIMAGNFKVTNADSIRRFLASGANQFNYQNLPTISPTRNTRDSDGGERLRRRQNWMARNRPNNQGEWVIDQTSLAKHNQLVEKYNLANSVAISTVNHEFTRLWDQLNSQRENLPVNKRTQKLLTKIANQSQQKLGQDEEITVFMELQELVLLDANAEVEQIIKQANQNFRQMEINQLLYEKKCQLIWWISKLLNEAKPTILEQEKPTDEEEKLSPPKLEDEEEQLESDNDEEKIENDKGIEKVSPEQAPPPVNAGAKKINEEKNDALFAAQEFACQKIKQLLEKYSLTNQDLSPEYQNWQEQIQKLNSEQAINQFLQQMEAAINKKAQTLNQTAPHSPAGKNDYHLLWLGLGAIVLSAGGLIILFTSSWQKRKISKN